ncbi:MAG: DUF4135 domain-containing protein, partial [Streptomycetaceae bacterium]|nr:DUF4135 domain-containing protein [Streptomycetaceae bacterium]
PELSDQLGQHGFALEKKETGIVSGLDGAGQAIQHAPMPAMVTKDKSAGLHRSIEKHSKLKIKRHGINVFNATVPEGEIVWIDPAVNVAADDPGYVWARYPAGGHAAEGHIRMKNVQVGEVLPGTNLYFMETETGHQLLDAETLAPLPEGSHLSDTAKAYLHNVMTTLNEAEQQTGLRIQGRGSLTQQILKDSKQLLTEGNGPWGQAPQNLNLVRQRVEADRSLLVNRRLITSRHQLAAVEYTGSDFHKGGQQVLFLHFTAPATDASPADRRTIVYKPSSLQVDAKLYGRGGKDGESGSVASTLDPEGQRIPKYTIVPVTKDGRDAGYGYMEFVASGSPRDAADLLGIYESIGANMAMSYLVGLEDVHHQNVLLLKDRLQVIDMEATTGIFHPQERKGFEAQLWNKAINEKVREELLRLANEGWLTNAPETQEALDSAMRAFKHTLTLSLDQQTHVRRQAWDLAQSRSRFVPIATQFFQDLIFVVREKGYEYREWLDRLETERKEPDNLNTLAHQALGSTGSTLEDMHTILSSRAVFEALKRGDVPYFSRDLGSSDVYDEAGTKLPLSKHPKIGSAIDGAIEGRMNKLPVEEAGRFFATQALPLIQAINDRLHEAITTASSR